MNANVIVPTVAQNPELVRAAIGTARSSPTQNDAMILPEILDIKSLIT